MGVFDDLKDAFRQAVVNFRTELHRDRIPETADELLREMRGELVDARAHLRKLEDDIREALERAEAEGREARTCRRRERLAREIDDAETARVAREFAERHERSRRVLERKALALKEELDLGREEVGQMRQRLEEARRKRESLTAAAGRRQARDSLRDADDLFEELDRMSERVGDVERRARAARELDEELSRAVDPERDGEPEEPSAETEARLRELRRRMDRDA